MLDEDDRDFKRTRKPVEETEEKPILTTSRDYHSYHKAKKRRVESDHDTVIRIKVSRDDSTEDAKSDVKTRIKEEESSRKIEEESYRKRDEDSSRKKDEENSQKKEEDSSAKKNEKSNEHLEQHERPEKKRESSSGMYSLRLLRCH